MTLVDFHEAARTFHARGVPSTNRVEIWRNRVTGPALVLGSTQRADGIVDDEACRAAGADVVRRRSGGGAVYLAPGSVEWIDVFVPESSAGWGADIHAPMRWLGRYLAEVLRHLGAEQPITVHDGAMLSTPWSSLICFDGRAPGEVVVAGRKAIGISQRRTRSMARLQCAWYVDDPTDALLALLAADVRPRADAVSRPATLPAEIAHAIPAELARRLPR